MSQHKNIRHKQGISDNHLPFKIVKHTLACERHPLRNEDSLFFEQASGLAAVFDGVGGSAAGEIASQTARRAALHRWHQELREIQQGQQLKKGLVDCSTADYCAVLQRLVEAADEEVRTEGAREAGTDDLATTVAMAMFCHESNSNEYTMFYAHVGDSRVYLLHENEPLKRLTIDDGLLGRLVESQMVEEENALRIDQAMRAEDLTDVEFSYFRLRGGITQALGGPVPPNIHLNSIPIAIGDRVLLCTDGIHDNLTDLEIQDILRTSSRHAAARNLVERSLLRSREERFITIRAKPDDMSATVITRRF
ncbi:MAG TPA: PP2C family serine/threonine-protein phosphatase [Ktedonobacteraceae bacterium]|nr:PP2C family serine/threonine-protein phosphatase [Ktedonobacteraceae bacterium]